MINAYILYNYHYKNIGFLYFFTDDFDDIVCSSCQLQLPASEDKCSLCNNVVHMNDSCRKYVEDKLLCCHCFNANKNKQCVLDVLHEENWRGKNVPPKKRIRESYLDPQTEFLEIDFSKKKVTPVGLLRNGHLIHLKPVKFKNCSILLSNTCGFDSISQIFATAYCDSKSFQTYLESIVGNEFITFVLHMIKKGVCASTYKKRADCFLTWPRTELAQGLTKINGEATISEVLDHFFHATLFSVEYIENCKHCSFISIKKNLLYPVG